MQKKLVIIIGVLAVLVIGGAAFMMLGPKAPSVQEIRKNPALFIVDDYPDKIALHTRVSSLFPRGTSIDDVQQFMDQASLSKTDETYFECTYKVDYGRIAIVYKFPEKTLERVQVDSWPENNEYCKPELTPVPENEQPIVVPLMPLPGDNQ